MTRRRYPGDGQVGGNSNWCEGTKLRGKKFDCKRLAREVDEYDCEDDYAKANAFENEESPCFRCPQGKENRERFSGIADVRADIKRLKRTEHKRKRRKR